MAREIDEEIRSFLKRGYDKARALLDERRGLLDRVVARLLVQGVISGQEFAGMVKENAKTDERRGSTE